MYISNYVKEIAIPINEIKSIRDYLGPRMRRARICFCGVTEFGAEVVFLPRDSFLPWQRSRVVAELRKMADLPEL